MRWKGRRQSDNIEDRRGQGGGAGRFRIPMGMGGRGAQQGGGMGIIGIIVVIGIMLFFPQFGKMILGGGGGGMGLPKIDLPGMPGSTSTRRSAFPPHTRRSAGLPRGGMEDKFNPGQRKAVASDEMKGFLAVVLGDTEDVWREIFGRLGKRYNEPRMVMFSGRTQTACGIGMQQMGPFYCPNDNKVYIDTAFLNELKSKFGASGDFAQAYVVAHEIGHHVQNELGIIQKVQRYKARFGQRSKRANAAQVRVELQADCFAGVWAKRADRAKKFLEKGDLEEALNAANAIGDDKIQRRTTGYVRPDSFTHGSSAQRVRWFRRGFDNGSISACDTFASR